MSKLHSKAIVHVSCETAFLCLLPSGMRSQNCFLCGLLSCVTVDLWCHTTFLGVKKNSESNPFSILDRSM